MKQLKRRGMPLINSFLDHFGSTPVKEIGKLDLEDWLDLFADKKGFSAQTKRAAKHALSPFFADLVDKKILESNPLSQITIRLGTRKKHHAYLSKPDVKIILEGL